MVGGTESDDDDDLDFQSPRGSDLANNSYSPSGSPNGLGSPMSNSGMDNRDDDNNSNQHNHLHVGVDEKPFLFPGRATNFHLKLQNNTSSSSSSSSPNHQQTSPISIRRNNPFSIESLLFNNT